jgi:2-polyprenyl-3-methyl-5-hydroxy-6-metoxy-1,4-benzoquinol methylase
MSDCPLCGGNAVLRSNALPGYVAGTSFQIHSCIECGVAFAEPRIESHEVYEAIYADARRIPGYARYEQYARLAATATDPLDALSNSEDVYWAVSQALKQRHKPVEEPEVLEVGSGLGYLTYALARSGYRATGIDISRAAIEAATARFGNLFIHADVAEFATRHAGRFDAVIACELLEHVVDPVAFVRTALSLIAPSGQLIVTTPNRTMFDSEVLWETDLPPVHFWWHSEGSIRAIATAAGARADFVDFSAYQAIAPLYVPSALPRGVPTRRPILDQSGGLFREVGLVGRARVALGDALPILRTNARVQRLLGRRRVVGPRRTVLCAVLRHSASPATRESSDSVSAHA